MRINKYVIAVVTLALLAVAFGIFGAVAPPLANEPEQEPSSDAVGHFQNPPTYDSGWLDVRDKAGQYFNLTHSLNTTDVCVYITGRYLRTTFDSEWNRTYGGALRDEARSLVQTADGGYALTGWTESFGGIGGGFWLVKTDSAGIEYWNKTYDRPGVTDAASSLLQTADGGYTLVGGTYSSSTHSGDVWLVKTDSAGEMVWNRTHGGTGSDGAFSLVQTGDGGYAIVGLTQSYGAGGSDFWLVKTNSTGHMQWNKTYGGTGLDEASSLLQTADGGYALAGLTYSYGAGAGDFWLVKTDSVGTALWNRTYGGGNYEKAFSLVQTGDGGYTIAGYTFSYGAGRCDFWLVKTDASGNHQWNKTYGGVNDDYTFGGLVHTIDDGYAVAGYTDSYGAGARDFWLVKTDQIGNLQWNKTCGGPQDDRAYSLVQTADGGYVLAGLTYSYGAGQQDFWLVKVGERQEMGQEHQRNIGTDTGLTWTELTDNSVTLYRGGTDPYWNYVRVRMWLIKEPSWIYGDINMDGVVDAKDLYILGRNYGKTFSLLSLGGTVAVAGIYTIKKRKKSKQPSDTS